MNMHGVLMVIRSVFRWECFLGYTMNHNFHVRQGMLQVRRPCLAENLNRKSHYFGNKFLRLTTGGKGVRGAGSLLP